MTSLDNKNKKIGLIALTAIVIGNLIGSGVFLLPANLAKSGSISLFGWVITALGAIFLALIFGKLSSLFPQTGGPHVYAEKAFGERAGFFVAWSYWSFSWLSNPALAVAAVAFLSSVVPISTMEALALELLIMLAVTVINLKSIRLVAKLELILTALKVILLIVIPMTAFLYFDINNLAPFNNTGASNLSALNAVAILTLWSYIGLETGAVPSEEVENPKVNVPKAIIFGVLAATLVYVVGTFAIMGAIPVPVLANSQAPYADIASLILGDTGRVIVSLMAILCVIGTLNGWTLVVGRIAYGAATEGLFPKLFTKLTSEGAPKWGVLVSNLFSIPILVISTSPSILKQFEFIIYLATTLMLVIYLISVLAYLKILISTKTYNKRNLLLCIGGGSFCIWAIMAANPSFLIWSMIIVILGLPLRLYVKKSF